ncbi:peptidoglycan DD-metalloendopeptidase family protein [Candidatus Desantisbacteria bacterium]|nr:peptidoglycan DD-metalloendopeptidase family protein [Candidatus Desantisbacteria bacterium]
MAIFNLIAAVFIFFIVLPDQVKAMDENAEKDSSYIQNYNKKKDDLSWSIKEFYKSKSHEKIKNLENGKKLDYFLLKRKTLKNIVYYFSMDDLKAENKEKVHDTQDDNLVKFKKNYKKLALNTVSEYNEAVENLKKLVEFFEKNSTGGNSNGNVIEYSNLTWPVSGRIISSFGQKKITQYNAIVFENGIKIKSDFGENISAVEKGVVEYADWLYGFGKILIIEHGNDFYSIYGYLSEILTERGAVVSRNQVIGKVGDSGTIAGTCLYFGIIKSGKPVNPEEWLSKAKE